MSDEKDDPFAELDDEDDGSDPFEELGEGDDAVGEDDPFAELDGIPAEGDVPEGIDFEDREGRPESRDDPAVESLDGAEGEVVVVPKGRYCESCEHFGAPPKVRCTHPDAEILELVGMDEFVVRNCPVVAQRREAGMVPEGEVVAVEEQDDD